MTRILHFLVVPIILGTAFFSAAQDKPELVVTTGHIAVVNCVAFDPTGEYILTGSEDRTLKLWSISLQQEYRTLYGHTAGVAKVIFSPDGKLIGSTDGVEVIVWKHPGGEIVNRFKSTGLCRNLAFSADSKCIITEGEEDDQVVMIDILTKELKNTFKGLDADIFIGSSSGERLFSSIHAEENEGGNDIAVTDVKTGNRILSLKQEGRPLCMTSSANGKLFAEYFNSPKKQVWVWDVDKGTVKIRIDLPATTDLTGIVFNVEGTRIFTASRDTKARVYDLSSGKMEKEITSFIDYTQVAKQKGAYKLGTGMLGIDVSRDGKTIVGAEQYMQLSLDAMGRNCNSAVLWDVASGKQSGELGGMMRFTSRLWACKDQPILVSANYNPIYGIKFWNLKDGSVQENIQAMGISAASAGADTLLVWQGASAKTIVLTVPENEVLFSWTSVVVWGNGISADGSMIAIGSNDYSNPANVKWFMNIFDVKTKKMVKTISVDVRDVGEHIYFTGDKKYVIVNRGDKTITWEIASAKVVNTLQTEAYDQLVKFLPWSNSMLFSRVNEDEFQKNESKLEEINCITGKVISTFTPEGIKGHITHADYSSDGKYMALAVGGPFYGTEYIVALLDRQTKKVLHKFTGHFADVLQVCFSPDGKSLYSASQDGTIKLWNIESEKETGTLIGMLDLDYIIFTPDNYYKSSKGNYDGICFRLNNKLYTFEQFDMQYNRPDLVMASLGAPKSLTMMYKLAWTKRIKRAGFTEEMLNGTLELPELELPDKKTYTTSTTGPKMKVKIRANDKNYNLDRVQVYVNEVPVFGMNGFSLKDKKTKLFDQEMEFELCAGKNLVQVFAVNEKGLESLKESFEIDCKKPVIKPDLYILAVGVARYQDKNYNLKYSSKDMNDFVNMMQTSGNYGKVIVKKLSDSSATKENIIASGKIFTDAKVDDHVIIYFSCHGLLDDKMDYYLATTDVKFEDPSVKGMPYDEIEKMLDLCRSRNRLILIDACHSGEVDKSDMEITNEKNPMVVMTKGGGVNIKPKTGLKNSFAYMQALFSDVAKGSGAVVISAAAGAEFALESNEWNNGVFTYCIMNGFKSGEADTDNDKVISISELKNYVITHVSELTHGAQVPTVRKENSYNDFQVYKKVQ
jgi:WD40 repeat protein